MVSALGITWLLDGLEVTLAGSLASVLKDKNALGLTSVQVGASANCYRLFVGFLELSAVPHSYWLQGSAENMPPSIEQRVRQHKGDLKNPEGSLKITVRDHTPL